MTILTRVYADGLLGQLSEEIVQTYDDSDTVTNHLTALLALQQKLQPLTLGTIQPTDVRSLVLSNQSILSAILTLHESVGGYIYVDTSRAIHWLNDIGEDKGQQIRYRKNIKGLAKETDYDTLCTRLFMSGSGEVKLSDVNIENEVATKSFDVNFGYLELISQYVCYDGWTALGDALPGEIEVSSGAVWNSPTGSNPDASWTNHPNTYDDDVGSFSYYTPAFAGWSTALELTFPAVNSSKLKCYLGAGFPAYITKVRVETFGVGWVNEYEGPFPIKEWMEVDFAAPIANMTEVRFSFWNSGTGLRRPIIYEVKVFNDDNDESGLWHQGADERTLRCAIGDYNGAKDYRVSYRHADYIKAWAVIAGGSDIVSKVETRPLETSAESLLVTARLWMDTVKTAAVNYIINGVDLSESKELDLDFDALQLGSIVNVIDEELGIDVSVRVVKITRPDMLNPQDIVIELTNRWLTIADIITDLQKGVSS